MSKASQYAESGPDDIERAKQIIARILAQRPGRDAAISSEELAERTPIESTTVRDTIPEIIAEYRIPIASCPDGYYRAETDDEFVGEMQRFESQRDAARSRMSALAQAYYGEDEVYV